MAGRKLIIAIFLLIFAAACASTGDPQPTGTAEPVIDEAWASPTVTWGETWKVYVKAHDPDGDMFATIFDVDMPGVLAPASWGYRMLTKDMRSGFDGYFYLHMPGSGWKTGVIKMTVTMTLEDRGNRKSRTVSFPLKLGLTPQQAPPTEFADTPLLPVSTGYLPYADDADTKGLFHSRFD